MRPSVVNEAEPQETSKPPTIIRATVYFGSGDSTLDDDDKATLATVVDAARADMRAPIVLRGNTDSRGDDEDNARISKKRAEAVRDFLVEQGVAKERITIVALGEARPSEPNALLNGDDNPEGRAKNRRVDIVVGAPEASAAQSPDEPS